MASRAMGLSTARSGHRLRDAAILPLTDPTPLESVDHVGLRCHQCLPSAGEYAGRALLSGAPPSSL